MNGIGNKKVLNIISELIDGPCHFLQSRSRSCCGQPLAILNLYEDRLQQHPAQLITQGDIIEDWKMKIAHVPCEIEFLCLYGLFAGVKAGQQERTIIRVGV